MQPTWRQEASHDAGLGPRSRRPIPYAVIATASDKGILEAKYPDADIHSSWKWAEWKFDPPKFVRSDLYIDIKGKGSGFGGFSLLPGYSTGDSDTVSWLYYWLPTYIAGKTSPDELAKHASYDWYCIPELDLNGYYLIHSKDTCFTSKEAGASLQVSIVLMQIKTVPQNIADVLMAPKIVSATKTVFAYSSDNILKGGWVKGIQSPGKIGPAPGAVFHPHWLIVSVSAHGWVRGDGSHVLVDFHSNNYDIYCHPLQVWEVGI